MNFDTIFALFVGPLLIFGMLTARDILRMGRVARAHWLQEWRYNLFMALAVQICVQVLLRLRAALLRI